MKIPIKGPIISDGEQFVYDWFGIPATSPSKVSRIIENARRNNVKALSVEVNSGGGSVFSASEIYTDLKKFQGTVDVEIVGVGASAASVIAMAATKGRLAMAPTGQLMIHNAATGTEGDYREMDHTSDFLQKVNQSIMNAYTARTGKTTDELKVLMDNTTWMTAQDAKAAGFIDSIMFENEYQAVANIDRPELVNGVLPPEVINKMREQLANQQKLEPFNSIGQPKDQKVEEDEVMNLEKLKAEHPELFKEVMNAGKQEGATAERNRIKEIENIAVVGSEDIINKAKFDTGITAAETAMEILKAQKEKGATALNAAKVDAAPLNQVAPTAEATAKDAVDEDAEVDAILNKAGKLRGVN